MFRRVDTGCGKGVSRGGQRATGLRDNGEGGKGGGDGVWGASPATPERPSKGRVTGFQNPVRKNELVQDRSTKAPQGPRGPGRETKRQREGTRESREQ